jgi:Ferritin-like domain
VAAGQLALPTDIRAERRLRKEPTPVDTIDHGEPRNATRRRVLQALGLGGALAVVPAAPKLVSAQPEPTTTVASPKYPTDDDIGVLQIAQMAELSMVELYNTILSDFQDDPKWVPVLEVFREHHEAYADALAGLLGRNAPNMPSQKLLDTIGDVTGEPPLAVLASIEQTLSSTHTTLLGALEGIDGAALIASIIPVEARHAAVLGAASGLGLADLIPAGGADDLSFALSAEDLIEA